jgi:hypothetical protein
MIKNIFIRDDSVKKKQLNDLIQYEMEKIKQEEEMLPQELQKSLTSVSVAAFTKYVDSQQNLTMSHNSVQQNPGVFNRSKTSLMSVSRHFANESKLSKPQASLFDTKKDSTIFKFFQKQDSVNMSPSMISTKR